MNTNQCDAEPVPAIRIPATADYPPGARTGPRVIDDHEFVWLLRGEARFASEEGEQVLTPGRLLLVPPGVRHVFTWDPRRASRHGYVHFSIEADGIARAVQARRMTEHDPMAGLCAYLLWLGGERPEAWEGAARRTLRSLLETFASGPLPAEDARTTASPPLAAAVDHLRRAWSQMPLRHVGVGDLASAAGVSRSYLNRLFRAEFGVSVASALERLRCSRAETLLARTDMTVGSIARQCGFADLYHFSHRFSRLHGMPPTAFRWEPASASVALDHPGLRRLAYAVWG